MMIHVLMSFFHLCWFSIKFVQPVPDKTKVEIVVGMEIRIRNGSYTSLFKRCDWKGTLIWIVSDSDFHSDNKFDVESHLCGITLYRVAKNASSRCLIQDVFSSRITFFFKRVGWVFYFSGLVRGRDIKSDCTWAPGLPLFCIGRGGTANGTDREVRRPRMSPRSLPPCTTHTHTHVHACTHVRAQRQRQR